MANAKPFDNRFIATVMDKVESAVVDRIDKIALRAHARLVQATPVDYGQARAGWNFTLNEISENAPEKPARVKGGKTVIPAPPSKPDAKATKSTDSYHISNFVKHIVYLNEGSSDKAPSKFIETELRAAVADVEGGQ